MGANGMENGVEDGAEGSAEGAQCVPRQQIPIQTVRRFLAGFSRGDDVTLDAGIVRRLDQAVDYRVYLAGGEAYTLEELCSLHPFEQMGIDPHTILLQQVILHFRPKTGEPVEIVAGAGERQFIRPDWQLIHQEPTKVYANKKNWEEFLAAEAVVRVISYSTRVGGVFGGMLGGVPAGAPAALPIAPAPAPAPAPTPMPAPAPAPAAPAAAFAPPAPTGPPDEDPLAAGLALLLEQIYAETLEGRVLRLEAELTALKIQVATLGAAAPSAP